MDPLRSYLGRLLLEEITPVVMVLTTPLAEAACRKSGLSFVDMLSPFSLFKKIDVPVRTASEVPYRLQMFKIRMVYASDVRKEDYEVADERIKLVVSEANEKALSDLLSDPPQLEDVIGMNYTSQHVENRSVSYETRSTQMVVNGMVEATLLVLVSSGLGLLRGLQSGSSVLNDFPGPGRVVAQKALGLNNHEGTCCLSMDDLNELFQGFLCAPMPRMAHQIATHLLVMGIVGLTEGMLRFTVSIEITVLYPADSRFFMGANAKEGTSNCAVISHALDRYSSFLPLLGWCHMQLPKLYTFTSIESQIRVLGDFAFMLRDYELALSNYRLLATDYKLDKAWKRFAGVQEMSGLCYFMLDQSRKDAEHCMDNAFSTYLRIGSSGQRNATRCGLWWAEMLKARGQYREASSVYFRVSNEEPSLHSAVLLEQAASCYLLSSPPMLRKYGFHLILAGNSYYMSDQKQHAVRAYRNALFVYKQNPWSYINDHVHFNIGRWYGVLGILDVAIKHLLEVIACSHQSLVTQNMFLTDIFNYVQSMGKKFDVYKLQLPVFNMSSLKVIHEDHRTYASDADVDVSESTWQELEEELIPSSSVVRTNWLDTQAKSLRKYKDSCVCVAGEAVKVKVELKNPLQIPVDVSGISLICQLSTNLDALSSDVSGLTLDGGEDKVDTEPSVSIFETDEDNFRVSKLDIVLGGGERAEWEKCLRFNLLLMCCTVGSSCLLEFVTVQLDVTPKVEGILKLVGIRWTLSNSVVGYQYFEFDTQKKIKKGKRGRRRSLNNSLVVIKGLPKLTGSIDSMPTKAFAGDLQLLKLNLRNYSEYTVKGIKMKISNPRFLIPCDSSDIGFEFPHCLKKHTESESNLVSYKSTKENFKGFLFVFPQLFFMQILLQILTLLFFQDIEVQAGCDIFPNACFFLKDFEADSCKEAEHGSYRSDIALYPGSSGDVFDIAQSPLADFHFQERYRQGKLAKGPCSLLDFVLISKAAGHKNSVRVVTSDVMPEKSQTAHTHDSTSVQGGWHDVSLQNDIKAISSAKGTHHEKQSSKSISPYVWCSLSSAQIELQPDSCARVPLKVCIFAPGTYNFSNYELQWKVHRPSEGAQVDENENGSLGGGQGHPFYVTVLQSV
ncbi:Trafficking protein particle complex subunit 8 [Dichanthelium oligosanthes]|uniref:Trafficking protein particle complex subunit 8 n=1 Tax=Dichanthelium oligosanthes TaxID=888268 RepID=A0A1E5WCC1_9POAL|nr:Trafficking protein particle complex subunit 8 [Dichanthelium oligosanthes]